MTFNQILLWGMLILPWLSLFFLKKNIIKYYMPVSIFTALLVTIYNELSYTQKWWVKKETIFPQVIVFVPFVYGAFLVGTLWIFYLTYKRFWLYIIANLITDGIFCFFAHNWFIKLHIVEDVKHRDFHIFIAFTIISIIAYGYQVWQDEVLKHE